MSSLEEVSTPEQCCLFCGILVKIDVHIGAILWQTYTLPNNFGEYAGAAISESSPSIDLMLESHRWVPLSAVGYPANGSAEENQEEVTPPASLMEHPPLAVFGNGISAAMNELRPCAPMSLKHVLAQELVKGLQAVSDSLLRYNATRMLKQNESVLFLSLCKAFIEVVCPHCTACFDSSEGEHITENRGDAPADSGTSPAAEQSSPKVDVDNNVQDSRIQTQEEERGS